MGLPPLFFLPDGYAMLMIPNKGETAVHGYHFPDDMVERMRTVLAIPRGWYVCLSADKCCLRIGEPGMMNESESMGTS